MQNATQLNQSIINNLQSHLSLFAYTPRELNALALGISQGLALAGASCCMLELAINSDNVQLMVDGGL
jgi:hypothetical protein